MPTLNYIPFIFWMESTAVWFGVAYPNHREPGKSCCSQTTAPQRSLGYQGWGHKCLLACNAEKREMPAWVGYSQAAGMPPKCVKRGMKESKVHLEKLQGSWICWKDLNAFISSFLSQIFCWMMANENNDLTFKSVIGLVIPLAYLCNGFQRFNSEYCSRSG